MMVYDIMRYGGIVNFAKGLWRYRWMGSDVPDRHALVRPRLRGLRGPALAASAWHYRAMTSETIRQFMRMFSADTKLHRRQAGTSYGTRP